MANEEDIKKLQEEVDDLHNRIDCMKRWIWRWITDLPEEVAIEAKEELMEV